MRRVLTLGLGVGLGVNGGFMLLAPETWYGLVPGVEHTGPFNGHFVRDVGVTYLIVAASFAWLAWDARARAAALAGAAILVLHGLIHCAEALAGGEFGHLARDLPGVFLPAAAALFLAWPRRGRLDNTTGETPVRTWLAKRLIARFERRFDYDMSYVREMLDTSPTAFMRFSRIAAMANHRENVPLNAWYAAKLATTLAEDCGPCTQLIVRMAEADGVTAQVLRAILAGDERAMGADAALGFRFAEASLRHDAHADELRDEVMRRWGKRALVSLALTIAATRVFPTVKYALGHGHACQRVEVGGAPARLATRQAA